MFDALKLFTLNSSFATGDKDGYGLKFANSGPIFCFNVGPQQKSPKHYYFRFSLKKFV